MNNLKKLREAAGLTQFELAVRAGVTPATIGHIEGGRVIDPKYETRRSIAAVLGVEIADVWPNNPVDESPAAGVR